VDTPPALLIPALIGLVTGAVAHTREPHFDPRRVLKVINRSRSRNPTGRNVWTDASRATNATPLDRANALPGTLCPGEHGRASCRTRQG
jgi:hypothetical protein